MQDGRRDDLLLGEQVRAQFNLTTYAKRVDSLITGGMRGTRAHHLPVIVLGTMIVQFHSVTVAQPNNV